MFFFHFKSHADSSTGWDANDPFKIQESVHPTPRHEIGMEHALPTRHFTRLATQGVTLRDGGSRHIHKTYTVGTGTRDTYCV